MKKYTPVVFGVLFVIFLTVFHGAFFNQKPKNAPAAVQKSSGIPFPVMMNQLSQNLIVWDNLGPGEKEQAVSAVITLYKNRDNIAILNTAKFYVDKIDETLRTNPSVRGLDVMTIIRILSVMEYDFYNGQNKDELAKQILGDQAYSENLLRRQAASQQR